MTLPSGSALQSEVVVNFALPDAAAQLTVSIGDGSTPSGTPVTRCAKDFYATLLYVDACLVDGFFDLLYIKCPLTAGTIHGGHIYRTKIFSRRLMEKTDMPGDDYNITHHPKGTAATVCQVGMR